VLQPLTEVFYGIAGPSSSRGETRSPFGPETAYPSSVQSTARGFRSALSIAEEKGLLKGLRTLVIRGRMPEELVAEAKRKTGISSDSKLLEAALAYIVVADDYAEWLFSQRSTVDPALDLEF
jgi:hypothetical protein